MKILLIFAVPQFLLAQGSVLTNVALEKTVELSSIFSEKETAYNKASYAVDGDKRGLYRAAVTSNETEPWLMVDLQEDALISSFYIQNLVHSDEEYSMHFSGHTDTLPWFSKPTRLVIEIGHPQINFTEVWSDKRTFGFNITIVLESPRCGRFVKLWLDAFDMLSINEIEVYGKAYLKSLNQSNEWSEWSTCSTSCGNGTTVRSRLCATDGCCGFVEDISECNTDDCPATKLCIDAHGTTDLAVGKAVVLSTEKGQATSGRYAVDGVKTGILQDGRAATQHETNPWMTVDLGDEYLISTLVIQNLMYDDWLLDFMWQRNPGSLPWYHKSSRLLVEIGRNTDTYTVVWDREEIVGVNKALQLANIYCGRFVRLSLQASDSLSVCELEVCGKEDEGWEEWTMWSQCSNSCGNGTSTRKRICTVASCCGYEEETMSCNTHACSAASDDAICNAEREPHDCQDIADSVDGWELRSGVYRVTPVGLHSGFDVYCELEGRDAWLVFQRRISSSENFNRTWVDYTAGFGNFTENSWLGLRRLYQILSQGYYKLRVELEDWHGNTAYAVYNTFKLGDSSTQYKLLVDEYSGNAGDVLHHYDGQPFVTWDRSLTENMNAWENGWWFSESFKSNLNGLYLGDTYDPNETDLGIVWKTWTGSNYSMKRTEMKIKRGD